jgi:hypothetical protein
MPPADASGWLRSGAVSGHWPLDGLTLGGPAGRQLPYSTAQHIPRRQASPSRGCTPQAKTALVTWQALQASAIAGDPTTVRVVTGEIPVRFMGYIPLNVVMNTFECKYPVLTVRLPAGTPVPGMPPSPGRRLCAVAICDVCRDGVDTAAACRRARPESTTRSRFRGRPLGSRCVGAGLARSERRANRRGAVPTVGGGR